MREEAEDYGMKYSPYPPYEILKTKDISYNELLKLKKVEAMVDKYYNSQKFNNIIKYFVKKFETPFDFYYELGDYFEKKGYFNRNIGNNEYYRVFLDFNMEILKEDNSILKEILRFDYLKFNKKRGIPDFIKRNIDKEDEERIKEKLRDKYSFKEYYLESFNININKFAKDSLIVDEKDYYLFGYGGDIKHINMELRNVNKL